MSHLYTASSSASVHPAVITATLSEHLLKTLPITTLGHFSFARRASEERRDTKWAEFVDMASKVSKRSFGWVRADETDLDGNRHLHAALCSFFPMSNTLLEDCWASVNEHKQNGHAVIQPYDVGYGGSGMAYIMKGDCLSFSDNISLYSSLTDVASLRSNDRRAYNRMRAN